MEELQQIDELLKKRIPDDLTLIINHGNDIDAWRYVVAKRLALETKKLTEEQSRYQLPKTKNLTEYDRKNYTELHTRDQQERVSTLLAMYQSIDKRINWIQSQMKSETELLKRG